MSISPRSRNTRRIRISCFSFLRNAILLIVPFYLLSLVSSVSQAAPGLSISAPPSAYVNEAVLIDARQSAGVSKVPQADGSPSVTINFGDGFSANLLATSHVYRAPGTYIITVTAKDNFGGSSTAQTVIQISSIPAAPNVNVQIIGDSGNAKTNGLMLQTAINFAAFNNLSEQEILLPAGAVFAGPIVLTTPTSNKYITIRSASLPSLPQPGNRVGPSDISLMPIITAPSSISAMQAAMWTPSPATTNPSHHYRLQGLSFKKDSDLNASQSLLSLGDTNSIQSNYSMQPTYFIVDRCYFDGGAGGVSNSGLRISADYVTISDSFFKGFKVQVGVDATAISIIKGKGPHSIFNNYLEASSENFAMADGGNSIQKFSATISAPSTTSCTLSTVSGLEVDMNIALPVGGLYSSTHSTIVRTITGNTITYDVIPTSPDSGGTAKWAIIPSFLEFRRNYLFKPLAWRRFLANGSVNPAWDGSSWQIKNLWETKAVRYAVIDGNVFQNSWIDAQAYGIMITPSGDNGLAPSAVTRDMQWSNNIFNNMSNGVAIAASGVMGGAPTQATSDITFWNNLWWNVGQNWGGDYRQFFALLAGETTTQSKRIHFLHQTFDNGISGQSNGMITAFGNLGDGTGVSDGIWKNNLSQDCGLGFFSSTSSNRSTNISNFMPSGSASNWDKNLIVNSGSAIYPSGAILQNGVTWANQFLDYTNGDFTLVNGSPGKNAAADGIDIGVGMSALQSATVHCVDGQWGSGAPPTPIPTPTPSGSPTPSPSPSPTPSSTPTPVSPSVSASFVQLDTSTKGNWKSSYGADGHNTVNESMTYPSYAQVSVSGYGSATWMASTTDVRGLQKAVAADRVAARWDSTSFFTIDLNITDGQTHRVAVYSLDWDGNNRAQRVDLLDWATNALLDSRTLSSFNGGKYLVWDIKGRVKISVNRTGAKTAVLSGLYFGGPTTTPTPTPTPTPSASPTPTPTPGVGRKIGRVKRDGQDLSNQLAALTASAEGAVTNSFLMESATLSDLQLFVAGTQEAYSAFNAERQLLPAAARIDVELTAAVASAAQSNLSATLGDLNGTRYHLREAINHLELGEVLITYGYITNAIDVSSYMVRQHYVDFLNREPDQSGGDFWFSQLQGCGTNSDCVETKRINASAAFFLSIEFQQTGYLVYRLYKSSYGRVPLLREFLQDRSVIARGVVVGEDGWAAKLVANQQAFIQAWTQRADFQSRYAGLTNDHYVDTLLANIGATITAAERDQLLQEFVNGNSPAGVLSRLVEIPAISRKEFNSAFVLTQYFGYLRRDPDAGGYNFWLTKLNDFDGNFVNAEMVKAFLSSTEYRNRFGR